MCVCACVRVRAHGGPSETTAERLLTGAFLMLMSWSPVYLSPHYANIIMHRGLSLSLKRTESFLSHFEANCLGNISLSLSLSLSLSFPVVMAGQSFCKAPGMQMNE